MSQSTVSPINLQPTHLKNSLVQLVPLSENDFEKLYAEASDPLIWEQHPQKERYQRAVFKNFFNEAMESKSAFLVLDAKRGTPIGSSRYYEYDAVANSIAIGYTFLARSYWGGPYNQALKALMLDYIFKVVTSVLFHIGPYNIRSQKAVLKLGAQKIEDTALNKDGEERFVYRLTKEDYEQHPLYF